MKLLVIITQEKNTKELEDKLNHDKLTFTKLDTKGGFLKQKNQTYLLAVSEAQQEKAVEIVKATCKSSEEIISTPVIQNEPDAMLEAASTMTVKVGGATIFVLPLEDIIKI